MTPHPSIVTYCVVTKTKNSDESRWIKTINYDWRGVPWQSLVQQLILPSSLFLSKSFELSEAHSVTFLWFLSDSTTMTLTALAFCTWQHEKEVINWDGGRGEVERETDYVWLLMSDPITFISWSWWTHTHIDGSEIPIWIYYNSDLRVKSVCVLTIFCEEIPGD